MQGERLTLLAALLRERLTAIRWGEAVPPLILCSLLVFARFRWALSPAGIGALVCGGLCLYFLRRQWGEDRIFVALGGGCAGWAFGALLGGRAAGPLPLSWLEVGVFAFAVGATVASLAWPEIRRGSLRLAATLIDALTVVAAVALWGSAGFPPLGVWMPEISLQTASRSVALLVPLVTALIVVRQLSATRRPAGIGLAIAAGALALGEFPLSGVRTWGGAALLQAGGFSLIAWAIWKVASSPAGSRLSWPDATTPPGLVPGLVAIAILVLMALVPQPAVPLVALSLGGCVAARAVLAEWDRRRAQRRLDATFEIGVRLAEMGEQERSTVREGLAEVCDAVAEAFRADAALVWIREGDALSLAAAGPQRLPELVGVRSGTKEDRDLAAGVYWSGNAMVCDTAIWGVHLPRGVCQALGAQALLAAPLGREAESRGVLMLARRPGSPVFSASDQWKAILVGTQVASVLNQARRHSDLARRLEQTTLVHRFATEAVRAGSPTEIGTLLLATVRSAAHFDRGSVRLADRSAPGGLRAVAHLSEGVLAPESAPSNLRLSLKYGATTVGELWLERAAGKPFTRYEEQAAEALCRFGATALHNHQLREESHKVSDLQDSDRAKTDLLRALSHDLRGPLTVIKGYAGSLARADDDLTDDERLFTLRTIEEEADRLTDLLNHMLDLSAIEAGRLTLDPQIVRLQRLVEQAIASVERGTHVFRCEVGDDVLVTADRARLREVLDNLLSNAVKYSPEGGTIEVRAAQAQAEVTVSVSDPGLGIPRHLLQRIFQPFERDSGGAGRGIMGTGLGLAIVKGLVEAHGGRIWAESVQGTGSTFHFTLPRAPEVDVDVVAS